MKANELTQLVQQQVLIRIGEENIQRIKKCLSLLSEEQVWFRFNENTNSVGNLILHLEGNATQWILSTLDNYPDHRKRSDEFLPESKVSKAELISRLDNLILKIEKTVAKLSEADLVNIHQVQCYQESGISILIHVIEHFSYHTGQIALITKLILNVDTGFYAGQNLTQTKN